MQHFALSGQTRNTSGKAALKALRAQGLVPCNLYGLGLENVLFTVTEKDLKGLTNTPESFIVDLTLDGNKTYTVILHELQWHPVTDACLHVDFLAVDDKKPIAIDVPLAVTGHSVGVQRGGKFFMSSRSLRISALMANLPEKITIDITSLNIDKKIKAGDVKIDNVTVLTNKDVIICGVKATRNMTVSAE